MTRNLLLSVVLLSGFAFGQATRYDNFTWTANPLTPGQSANVMTVPRATVHVCSHPANATPCTNYATIYSDYALSTPITQPGFASDDYGNFGFYSTTGTYDYTVTVGGVSSGPYTITLNGSIGTPLRLTPSDDTAGMILYGTNAANTVTNWSVTKAGVGTFHTLTSQGVNSVRFADQFSGSDIGAKINAAAADLGATGGIIVVPALSSPYSFSTQIAMDSSRNITIQCQGRQTGGAQAATQLLWTGTGTPISAKSSAGFRLTGCQVAWNNASFAGTVVDLSSLGTDTAYAEIDHNGFFKSGSGAPAPIVINLDKAITSIVHDNAIQNYVVGVQGAINSSSYSNAIQIVHNSFSSSTGTAQTSHIRNPQQAWEISSNTFEMGAGAGTPAVVDFDSTATQANSQGCSFRANWIGDTGVGFGVIVNAGFGWDISGNYISCGSSVGTATAIKFRNTMRGGSVQGNEIANCLNGIDLGVGGAFINVMGNNNSATNPYVGTQTAGRTEQPGTGVATEWGGLNLNSVGLTNTGPIAGATTGSFSGQITSTVTTGTAPLVISSTTEVSNLNSDMVDGVHVGTVTAGRATCWKDSTHIGSCSTAVDAGGACTCN